MTPSPPSSSPSPQADLENLNRRIDQTRWPDAETVDDWIGRPARQSYPEANMTFADLRPTITAKAIDPLRGFHSNCLRSFLPRHR
jgi:hypothetical protein